MFRKFLFFFILIPLFYLLTAFVLSLITVNAQPKKGLTEEFYLSSNDIHLDIILPYHLMDDTLASYVQHKAAFVAFGWGDKELYLETPEWKDLTVATTLNALFVKSNSLLHIVNYEKTQKSWKRIAANPEQIKKLNSFLKTSFKTDKTGKSVLLKNKSYGHSDFFFEAKGSYHCFNTCNTWVNRAFKKSKLKACYWTPFDFPLMAKY